MILKSDFFKKGLLLASFIFLITIVWCFQYGFTAWIIWFAYIPFFVYFKDIKGSNFKLFFCPFLVIFFTYCVAFNWLFLIPKNQHWAIMGIAIESLVDSLPFGIYLILRKKTQNEKWIWAVPFLLCIIEYIWWHLNIMTPVPLAHTQAPLTYVSQHVDLFGNTGATFLIMLLNVTVFRYWQLKKSIVFIFSRLALILIFPVGYSLIRIYQFSPKKSSSEGLTISLFRLDIPSESDDMFQTKKEDVQRLERDVYLLDSVAYYEHKRNEISDLYVWHESAFTRKIKKLDNYVQNIIKENGVPVLTGVEMTDSNQADKIINGTMVFYPDGTQSNLYTKMNFVTLWEADYTRGKKYITHTVKNTNGTNFSIATPICFEQFVPEHWATFRRKGAEIFVQVCFETWFRNGFGVEPGISNIAALRCMENKIYGARTSNGGGTAIFDPLGQKINYSNSDEIVKGVVYKSNFDTTVYTKYPWLGIILVLIGFFVLKQCDCQIN